MTIPIGARLFHGPFGTVREIIDGPGVYAVVCRERAGGFFLVDVGESDKVRSRLENHDRQDCWARVCAAKGQAPEFGVLYTERIPEHYRRAIEKEIRTQYQPPCGKE